MKILIAENDFSAITRLSGMLELDGYEVAQAESWQALLVQFMEFKPDLVLLEVALPGMPGDISEIKRLKPDSFVPVILVTEISCPITLGVFLGSGADDFIAPPYNHSALKAKISSFKRMGELYRRLENFRDRTQQELDMAKHMFKQITNRKLKDAAYMDHWALSAGHFNGDLLIYERTPAQTLHIMLCDFTGHGLAAAIGALPTSDIFYSMTKKGYSITQIACEINSKLHRLMPTGQFCAACLLCISPRENHIEVWNGGLPPILLLKGSNTVTHRLASNNLPLGILDAESFSAATVSLCDEQIDHIVLYSDGLVEAENAQGHPFGDHGLSRVVHAACVQRSLLQHIKNEVIQFLGGLAPHDDISLLTIDMKALS